MFLEGIYKPAAEPQNLHEAAAVLQGLLPAREIAEIAAVKKQSELYRWQMSLGDYVRHQFRLEDPDSALMKNIGAFGSPEDFCHEIVVALWIRLQPKH
jgi:hypothetical protein